MEPNDAALILESLLERIHLDGTIGSASTIERKAIQVAIERLRGTTQESQQATAVSLNLSSLDHEVSNPDLWLCLDFGTALSKAFATTHDGRHIDLALGLAAGGQGFGLPSSLLIADDGRVYFGQEAIDRSLRLTGTHKARIDSIKGWISLQSSGSLDDASAMLGPEYNPTTLEVTQRDIIRIYLAYLTDVAGRALEQKEIDLKPMGRYVRRRFARPCWSSADKALWADGLMRKMLAEAQILADTFSGAWKDGLSLKEVMQAMELVDKLAKIPEHLIGEGVPEPVAVAASAIDSSDNLRDAFAVIDVGAGTTDFGVFISAHRRDTGTQCVFQFPKSVLGVPQAGDRIDQILRSLIVRRESLDGGDVGAQLVLAEIDRTVRSLKEVIFKTGAGEYAFANGVQGTVTSQQVLEEDAMRAFSSKIEDAFARSISLLDDEYLNWLARPGVKLHVVLTGGGSRLPMIQALANSVVAVRDFKVQCTKLDATPGWVNEEGDEFIAVYPQLAVAIGGSAGNLPEVIDAPAVFGGGGQTTYVSGKLHIGGA